MLLLTIYIDDFVMNYYISFTEYPNIIILLA
jgi:hypothetical protein